MGGHEVLMAYDGLQALAMAERDRPAVVVLDIGMPGLTGYEVAHAIRSKHWGADVILIALTGWASEGDQHSSAYACFNHYLMKPIHPEELEALLVD